MSRHIISISNSVCDCKIENGEGDKVELFSHPNEDCINMCFESSDGECCAFFSVRYCPICGKDLKEAE